MAKTIQVAFVLGSVLEQLGPDSKRLQAALGAPAILSRLGFRLLCPFDKLFTIRVALDIFMKFSIGISSRSSSMDRIAISYVEDGTADIVVAMASS